MALRGIDREWSGGGDGGPVVVVVVVVVVYEEVVSVLNVVVQTVVGSPVDVVVVDAERTPRPLVVVVGEASRHLRLRPRRLLLAGAGLPGPRHRVAAELRLEAQEVLLELRLANQSERSIVVT